MSYATRALPGLRGALVPSFTEAEIAVSALAAAMLQGVLLRAAGDGREPGRSEAEIETVTKPIPIKVKPVVDDLPLLKLGGKKKLRAKRRHVEERLPFGATRRRAPPAPGA